MQFATSLSPAEPDIVGRGIAALLEQVCRRVSRLAVGPELNELQWSALRFFSRAGAKARTVGGVAAYLGSSQSTASRTVASLVERGLLVNVAGEGHPRAKFFALTGAGVGLLDEDPLRAVERAIQTFDPVRRVAMAALLEELLEKLPAPRDAE